MERVILLDCYTKQIEKQTLVDAIKTSSYFRKNAGLRDPEIMNREQLEQLYSVCRDHACRSIVDSLYPLAGLQGVVHIDCAETEFRILARVETVDDQDAKKSSLQRKFQSYVILTEKNLSYYPGEVLRGFSSNVSPKMIGYISPIDGDTTTFAKNRLELISTIPEMLLDMDDLCEGALKRRTYPQVSVATTYKVGKGRTKREMPLLPDCIIAIDTVTEENLAVAKAENKPLVVLHPAPDTIMEVNDYFFGAFTAAFAQYVAENKDLAGVAQRSGMNPEQIFVDTLKSFAKEFLAT